MRIGRPIPPLSLTDDERETLKQWARRPKTGQALAQRARIILACAEGKTNTTVAARLRLTKQMVGKWRTRFLNKRLDGLLDEPRPALTRNLRFKLWIARSQFCPCDLVKQNAGFMITSATGPLRCSPPWTLRLAR